MKQSVTPCGRICTVSLCYDPADTCEASDCGDGFVMKVDDSLGMPVWMLLEGYLACMRCAGAARTQDE